MPKRGVNGDSDNINEQQAGTKPAEKDTRTEDLDALVKGLESEMKRLNIDIYARRFHGQVRRCACVRGS